jgi:prepilin peptidase CpaA
MDVATFRISNRLVLALLAGYMALAPLAGFGLTEIGLSALAASAVLLSGFALFALGSIGGGDAKLAAVAALWLGADHTFAFLAYSALFGGLIALLILQMRSFGLPARLHAMPAAARLSSAVPGVPYGLALALGVLVVLPHTSWMPS